MYNFFMICIWNNFLKSSSIQYPSPKGGLSNRSQSQKRWSGVDHMVKHGITERGDDEGYPGKTGGEPGISMSVTLGEMLRLPEGESTAACPATKWARSGLAFLQQPLLSGRESTQCEFFFTYIHCKHELCSCTDSVWEVYVILHAAERMKITYLTVSNEWLYSLSLTLCTQFIGGEYENVIHVATAHFRR